jgi:competence protein ComGC
MRGHVYRSSAEPRSTAGAFTLVELLVVIGIVALLIAILLPVLSRARAQANRVACLSNIKQLGTAVLMYCNDNKGYFPTCAMPEDGLAYVHYPEDWIHWQAPRRNLDDSAIAKYVGQGEKLRDILRCPADTLEGRRARIPPEGPYLYSYAMNANLAVNFKPYGPRLHTSKITNWRTPATKILLGEALETSVLQPAFGYANPLTRRHGTAVFHGNVPGHLTLFYGAKTGKSASTVFLDGHAVGIDQDLAFNRSLFEP